MKTIIALTVTLILTQNINAQASENSQQANDNQALSESNRKPAASTVDDTLLADLEAPIEMTVQLKRK
jgi:hypothetical protein